MKLALSTLLLAAIALATGKYTNDSNLIKILISQLYFLNFYLGQTTSLPPAPAPSPTAECECKVCLNQMNENEDVPEWLCEPLRGCYDSDCRREYLDTTGYDEYDLVECMGDRCLGNFPTSVLDSCGIEE